MSQHPSPIQDLINTFRTLPGIGAKSAERIVFRLLSLPKAERETFAKKVASLDEGIQACAECGRYDTATPCSICANPRRDRTIICLVAEPQDILAIEKTGDYSGVYHLLGGVLNPLEGITPEKLRIEALINRVKRPAPKIREIIIATNPDMEGESTALYIARLLKPFSILTTRLARGLPLGANIEYADEMTLGSSLKERKKI